MPTINTKNVYINKEYTVAVTGHRKVDNKINISILKSVFKKFVCSGYDTFLVGMAVGFDTLCFNALTEIRKEYNIRIIACIPCEEQEKNFSLRQKIEYKELLNIADEKIILSKEYTPYCMLKRNRFMVDNCNCLLAYLREEKGGTKYTVNYAQKKGVYIEFI